MRIINHYVTRSFVVAFLWSLTVITFVMSLGAIFKVTSLLARGTSMGPILQTFTYALVPTLMYSLPISALVSSLLVFGRLSADGEITAMKACGISLPQVMRLPIGVSLFLVLVCIFITSEIAPRGHYVLRSAVAQIRAQSPTDLIEEGQFIDGFDGLSMFIGKKTGNRLTDICITDRREPDFERVINAASGVVETNGTDLLITLQDGRIDPFDREHPNDAAYFSRLPIRIKDALKSRAYTRQRKDMTISELVAGIRDPASTAPKSMLVDAHNSYRMSLMVELNKRLALSLSCLSFVALGIPLGIRSHRKESTIGIGISLLVVIVFYLFIVLAESMHTRPSLRPDLIMWIPTVAALVLSTWLVRKQN